MQSLSFLALLVELLCLLPTCSGKQTIVSVKFFDTKVSHIIPYNGNIYAVDSRAIYKLNEDLGVLAYANTCNHRNCYNFMKVFLINNNTDELVTCGTGNDGNCQVRNVQDIGTIIKDSSVIPNNTIVSVDEDRNAEAIFTPDGNLLIAVTYGSGIKHFRTWNNKWTYEYAISLRSLAGILPFRVQKRLAVYIGSHLSLQNYLISFKVVMQQDHFTYFATNQKRFVGDNTYVSKLIRLCNRDITNGFEKSFLSYVDIELSCKKNRKAYNLIQHAVIITFLNKTYFIGVFAEGSDPGHISDESAVCITSLNDIVESIQIARDQFSSCMERLTVDMRYFEKKWPRCGNESFTFSCEENYYFPSFAYVLGVTPLRLQHLMALDTSVGHGTRLFVRTIKDGMIHKLLDLHVGTSKGFIVKMSLKLDGNGFLVDQYERQLIHQGFPIVNMFEYFDYIYAASQLKVVRYLETNCSEFLTCADTMRGGNPHCGWCVYQGKSSRRMECLQSTPDSQWLSSLEDCISLSIEPKRQHATSSNGKVSLSLIGLHQRLSTDSYICVFKTSNGQQLQKTTAEVQSGNLTCKTPDNQDHEYVALEVYVKRDETTVTLATTEYLYYTCSEYTKCGVCTNTPATNCVWCTSTNQCQYILNQAGCSKHIVQKEQCPQLALNIPAQYIPAREMHVISIGAQNLDANKDGIYMVELNGVRTAVSNTTDTLLQCRLLSPHVLSKKEEFRVKVHYQKDSGEVELDDDHNFTVIVYNCSVLGKDCSHCVSVNTTRYQCNWCNENQRCQSKEEICATGFNGCPAPVVTKVTPSDGSFKGGTRVTIQGTHLGRSAADISKITLAGEECVKSIKDEDYLLSDLHDYMTRVPSRIVCTTSQLRDNGLAIWLGKAGNTTVTVSSKSGTLANSFTYKRPNITDITPKSGPYSGSTPITIDGYNLGIGNGDVRVYYNSITFTNCSVSNIDDKSSILCLTPRTNDDLVGLILWMDGKLISTSHLKFVRQPDPIINGVSPQKGILSGGTTITVTGENLSNAWKKTLTVYYGGDTSESNCNSSEDQSVKCKVPPATEQMRRDAVDRAQANIHNRSDCVGCTEAQLTLRLDGVSYDFTLDYFFDPEFNKFGNELEPFDPDNGRLVLTGANLNLVAKKDDIQVTIGMEECPVLELTEDRLTCLSPIEQPTPGIPGSEFPEVNVTVGYAHVMVGFLKYNVRKTIQKIAIIAGSVGGCVLILTVIGAIVGMKKYRRVAKRKRQLSQRLDNIEEEIAEVAKQRFKKK